MDFDRAQQTCQYHRAKVKFTVFFCRRCPACGRDLEIHLEFMGKRVECDYCGYQFFATAPVARNRATAHPNLVRSVPTDRESCPTSAANQRQSAARLATGREAMRRQGR